MVPSNTNDLFDLSTNGQVLKKVPQILNNVCFSTSREITTMYQQITFWYEYLTMQAMSITHAYYAGTIFGPWAPRFHRQFRFLIPCLQCTVPYIYSFWAAATMGWFLKACKFSYSDEQWLNTSCFSAQHRRMLDADNWVGGTISMW